MNVAQQNENFSSIGPTGAAQTTNNSQIGLNFHSLNQEYQIQFNRIN